MKLEISIDMQTLDLMECARNGNLIIEWRYLGDVGKKRKYIRLAKVCDLDEVYKITAPMYDELLFAGAREQKIKI